MKRLFLFFLVFTLAESFYYSRTCNPLEIQQAKQQSTYFRKYHVKSVVVKQFFYNPDTLEKEGSLYLVQKVNPNGDVTDEKSYSPTGDMSIHILTAYQGSGKAIKQEYWDYRRIKDTTYQCHTYSYDKSGRLAEEIEYQKTGLVTRKWKYTTDAMGRVTEADLGIERPQGWTGDKWKFSYDSVGHLLSEKYYDWDGGSWNFRYVYTTDGLLSKKNSYTAKDSLSNTVTYIYDKENRLIETHYGYGKSKSMLRTVNKYNSKGLLIETLYISQREKYVLKYTYSFYG